MSIKLILCPFHGEVRQLNVLVSAFQIASAHKAAVRVLHVAAPLPAHPYATGMSVLARVAAGLDISVERLEAAERELIGQSQQYVRRYAAEAGLAFHVDGEGEAGLPPPDVVLRVAVGGLADYLPVESRTSDLIVMGFDNRPDGDLSEVIAALYHTRRPVLLVPQTPGAVVATRGRPKTVAVAWDGSPACAQAVHDAMPFLVMATKVVVMHVQETEDEDEPLDADLNAYLVSHGVVAEFVRLAHAPGGVGERLLAEASAVEASLLVMGAYGHGHLTEFVFGGASNHVLKHAHLPLLMAR